MKLVLSSVALACSLLATAAEANDLSYFTTVFNTDWTETGLGNLRDDGTGTLTLKGITGNVTQAYLYWHGPTDSADPSINNSVSLGNTTVTGRNIGLSADNNWNYLNSQAYRADVTSIVKGNGAYSFADTFKPPATQNTLQPLTNINGASLVVFYDDKKASNNHDVVLFNGNDSNAKNQYDAPGWNVSLPGINYTKGDASVTLTVSDGQTYPDDALKFNGTTVAGPGAVFDGDSVAKGVGGDKNGGLWDVKTFDATAFLKAGKNTLNITTGVNQDLLSLVAVGISLPVGAAPVHAVPEPGTYAMMIAGLGGLAAVTRRRRAQKPKAQQ